MSNQPEDLIAAYASKGLLIDAHIAVLFVVGGHDRTLIAKFKRTQTYTAKDFDTLVAVFSWFKRILVTPHILAEVNSLLGQLPDAIKAKCFAGEFFRVVQLLEEEYVSSRTASSQPAFGKLGLSDSTICGAPRDYLVLTDDFALYGTLEKLGAAVINFNHLRSFDRARINHAIMSLTTRPLTSVSR